MSVIIILLIASISVAGLFLFAFLWGVKKGSLKMIILRLPAFYLTISLPHPTKTNDYESQ